jgi:mono/diheme cytochrome c family protein
MADPRTRRRRIVAAVGLLAAGVAWASPWDIDMVDAHSFKAYEWKMLPQPTSSVQRQPTGPKPATAYQTAYVANVDRTQSAVVDTMVNPFPADEAHIAEGKRLFQVTCAPCHGVEGKGGGPVTNHNPAQGLNRFPLPAPLLSGAGAVTAVRSDGYLYATIRNGGALMPAYGISLTEQERWSIVTYMRTLDGAQYTAPAAPAAPAPTGGTPG